MFYLSEDGKFGQDNFKSVVLRWTINKQADIREIWDPCLSVVQLEQ